MMYHKLGWVVGASLLVLGCGDGSTEADRLGVGWECTAKGECVAPEQEIELECLAQFKGGYCGLQGCGGGSDVNCPEGSACVMHDDGENYCFRICVNKYPDCNYNRSPDNESNCSANIDFVDDLNEQKACVPPSGS